MKVPLADQIGAVQAALDGRIMTAELTAALRTLQWLAKNSEAVKAAYNVVESPAVKAVLAEFPGAKVTEIKKL